MKFIQNWFDKMVRRSWERANTNTISLTSSPLTRDQVISMGSKVHHEYTSGSRLDSDPNLRFNMYRAENGYIMEVRVTDKRTERTHHNLHLIPDSDDLGKSIAEIITVESLKVS